MPMKIITKTNGKTWLLHGENMKNADTEWRFLGDHQKMLHFKFVLFLTFAKKWKSISQKENPENTFLQNQKMEKSATTSQKPYFPVF